MTILKGEQTKFETMGQFRSEFRVTPEEAVEALPEDVQQKIVEWENECRREEADADLIESPHDASKNVIEECLIEVPTPQFVINVLEARDQPYIHTVDNAGVAHTVIELYQDPDINPELAVDPV